jgi:diguanylate cyclase (GGDEF)-like protein
MPPPEPDHSSALSYPTGADAVRRVRIVTGVQLVAAVAAVIVVIATARSARWDVWSLAIITALTVTGDLTHIDIPGKQLKLSSSFLGLVLAAVLLNGGPAALVGVVTISVGRLRSRESNLNFRQNLVTYAWFPLLTGLLFHAARDGLHVDASDAGYYALAAVAFVFALTLNFLLIAGFYSYKDQTSLLDAARRALLPLLAPELFSALLTLVAIYFATHFGRVMLGLFALVLVVFQNLVAELVVSQRRGEELRQMATTDELTGLANRKLFVDRLDEAIVESGLTGAGLAVLLLDLDHFKEINDTLGHHYGDRVLAQLGPRLSSQLHDGEIVARLGGDEFGVLITRPVIQRSQLERLAADLIAAVQEPVMVDDVSLVVDTSVGISRYPLDGQDSQTLVRRADIAMYAAKANRDGYHLYRAEHDRHSAERLSVLGDFRRALLSDEIVVYYQPIVDLATGQVRAAEGLARWEHPTLGLLQPDSFLHVVEQTGLIGSLANRVLESAIAQCAEWHRSGHELTVAVNLSVRNLLDPQLPGYISRMLTRYGLSPSMLQLEITETMFLSDHERVLGTIRALRALGTRFAVDDFGTGHSSLANLRLLQIDELKLDRSFVTEMLKNERDLTIVRSTIGLAHDLGLVLVAEGVEDPHTLSQLAELGCDLAQGFELCEPIPADQFADWLRAFEAREGDGSLPRV